MEQNYVTVTLCVEIYLLLTYLLTTSGIQLVPLPIAPGTTGPFSITATSVSAVLKDRRT